MGRICADCRRNLPQSSYTANQFSKAAGVSRCASCVHGHVADSANATQSDSGRYSHSSRAVLDGADLEDPFADGTFRWVAKGTYTSGQRDGQACVLKWFKTGAVFSADYFTLDIKAVDKALEIVNRFNQLNILDRSVKINVPAVWQFDDSRAGEKALVEPFIENYQKFNSNTGWNTTARKWDQAMQALSHFSYHISGGKLCSL